MAADSFRLLSTSLRAASPWSLQVMLLLSKKALAEECIQSEQFGCWSCWRQVLDKSVMRHIVNQTIPRQNHLLKPLAPHIPTCVPRFTQILLDENAVHCCADNAMPAVFGPDCVWAQVPSYKIIMPVHAFLATVKLKARRAVLVVQLSLPCHNVIFVVLRNVAVSKWAGWQ